MAQLRFTAVGRAERNEDADARRIARRANGSVSAARSADSARPIAATWPMAGAPRTIIWRMALAASGAFRTSTSTSSSGRRRWSISRSRPRSSRKGVRKPIGRAASARAAAASSSSAASPRSAAPAGSRIAPAASADARWSPCGAPATVAAAGISSPAERRKNRRRARRACSSADTGSASTGATVPGASSTGATGSGTSDAATRSAGSRMGSAKGISRGSVDGDRSVLDDARDAPAVEAIPTLEEVELDEERQTDDVALQPLDELDRALDGAAGREEVVDDEDLLPRLDRVAVDLERVRAVLEGVLHGDRLRRQLAQLAHRDEAGIQLVGHGGAEDEAPRLHPDDDVDLLAGIGLEHEIDRLAVGLLVLQQRGDVVEQDPGLRKVRDLADPPTKLLGGHRRGFLQAGRPEQRAGGG